MDIIETRHLTKEFRGLLNRKRLIAVDDVSIAVKRGEIVGLLGVNGAGKTTLLKMICGLLEPSGGQVYVGGRSLQRHRADALQQIGAVLEGSRNSLWSLTVKQNLAYFGRLKHTHGEPLRKRGEELLNFFQLAEKENEVVKNLSKGMKQKLAIILAFINDPELILLDEPTLGLDIHTAALVKQRVVHLAHKERKTIFLTTHQIDIVEEICDRVAIIHQGKLLAFEATASLLANMGRENYRITFDGPPNISNLQRLPMVRDIQPLQDGKQASTSTIRLVLARKNILFELIPALQSERARVLSIERFNPRLEDVYVQIIGAG